MHEFDFINRPKELLTPEVVALLTRLHECRSRQELFIEAATYNPLILMPIFILDFLCIHPFNDGNGRMSRLLTLLLLYRAGFIVGKYISIEMLIEKTGTGRATAYVKK